jgi:hypothetical protein
MNSRTQWIEMAAFLVLLLASGACGSSGDDDDTADETLNNATGGTIAIGGTGGVMMTAATGGKGAAGMMAPSTGGHGAAGMMGVGGSGGMGTGGMMMMAVDAGMPDSGMPGMPMGTGTCCADGDCLCHGPEPTKLTSAAGPYHAEMYTVAGVGCVFYPTDAEAPLAAVAVADGFLGAGGCSSFQTGEWGPLYASWGIVAMIVDTGSSDQPAQRADALANGIDAFKKENTTMASPLFGKLAGRYGTSGFSMGGGGTTIAAAADPMLLSDVALMPWGPTDTGITVPTLIVCGSSDGTAPCAQHGTPAYKGIPDTVPKMRIQINSGHAGQPSSGMGVSGQVGLAFQKVFLEGDERWRPLLVAADNEDSNIK